MHGTTALKQAVKTLGSRVVDRRTTTGKALAAWRSELLSDLGSEVEEELAVCASSLIRCCWLTL